ncbi:MAG TPA: hypothetical protein VKY85_13945 [Candidatus Angelobacter sp.]|nr:hypothetical protein [Candidatus Angelobacter sp.]
MSRIHLRIDRLVLNGLQPGQEKPLIQALRTQLSQILSNRESRAAWARPHRTPVLKLGRIPLGPGNAGAGKFGAQLAREIGRGLKP